MGRSIVVSQTREVDLETLFGYELSFVPLSLFNPDGTMRKCCKSDLLKELERDLAVDELEETDDSHQLYGLGKNDLHGNFRL